ncbi:prepilin-type N-terminal cleavage/methylation domain-containing protein [bacterium]|nr:prepilin-type N-terminal cleavage/methylation domain-containing protein [bacterium]
MKIAAKKNKPGKRLTSDQGFTLVEVIIVIVIISIIAVIVIPKYVDMSEKAEESQCAANRHAISSAMYMTYAAILGNDPTQNQWLEEATMDDVSDTMLTMGDALTCPSGGDYTLNNGVVTCSVHGGP